MIPPRDQQSVEQIARREAEKEFCRYGSRRTSIVVTIGILAEFYTRAINAALTAHDEALPGEWTVRQSAGRWAIDIREYDTVFLDHEEVANAIVAAHNSALRALKEAGNG